MNHVTLVCYYVLNFMLSLPHLYKHIQHGISMLIFNSYLVHESLVEDPGFYASDGIMITELAMRCIRGELISVLP